MTLRFPCFGSRECLIECNACVCIMSQQNLKTCFCGLYNADLHAVLMLRHQKHRELPFSSYLCSFCFNRASFLWWSVVLFLCTSTDAFDFNKHYDPSTDSLIRHKSILQNILFIIRTFLLTFSTIWLMFSFHFLMPTHIPTNQSRHSFTFLTQYSVFLLQIWQVYCVMCAECVCVVCAVCPD